MSENIRVAIRIRPNLPNEESSSMRRVVKLNNQELKIVNGENAKSLRYDYIADPRVDQQAFYKSLGISSYIKKLFEGYSSTIFCYGTTGSGKTYTMQGENGKIADKSGLAPRCLESIFRELSERESINPRIRYSLSFIQLYNEKIYDVMSFNPTEEHKLRFNHNEMFFVEGLKKICVQTPSEALYMFI